MPIMFPDPTAVWTAGVASLSPGRFRLRTYVRCHGRGSAVHRESYEKVEMRVCPQKSENIILNITSIYLLSSLMVLSRKYSQWFTIAFWS